MEIPELDILWTGSPHDRWGNTTSGTENYSAVSGSQGPYDFVVGLLVSAVVWAVFNLVFQGVIGTWRLQRLRRAPPRAAWWEFALQSYVLRRSPAVVLHNLVKRYGPVMHVKAWSQDLLVLSSVAAVEEFYKLHDVEFGARPSSMGRVTLSNSFGSLCFPPLAAYWKHLQLVLDMTTSDDNEAGATCGIEWALEALNHHSNVVDTLCLELERNLEDHEELVQEHDITKLPYLQAVVKELFRLHPPCAVSFPHESSSSFNNDDCLFGFEVCPQTQVLINIYSLQRDPVMWINPDEFDPIRFVAQTDVDVLGHHFQLLPFGGGRWHCPGSKLAILRVQLGLARHFRRLLFVNILKRSLS